jgi:Leucine-rich repeat (LRR) protein
MAIMSEPRGVVLNLWKKRLGRVPDSVWDRTELEALILADNGLTEISERLGDLSGLRLLDLGHNDPTQVPESLGNIAGFFFISITIDWHHCRRRWSG